MLPIELLPGERATDLLRLAIERNIETLRQALEASDTEVREVVLAVLVRLAHHAREVRDLDLPLYRMRRSIRTIVDGYGPGRMDEVGLQRAVIQQLGIARRTAQEDREPHARLRRHPKEKKKCSAPSRTGI